MRKDAGTEIRHVAIDEEGPPRTEVDREPSAQERPVLSPHLILLATTLSSFGVWLQMLTFSQYNLPHIWVAIGLLLAGLYADGETCVTEPAPTRDHTERMLAWAKKRVKELEKEDLCGFIFKSDSPSSGMIRVKVYSEKGMPRKVGVGMFARAFMDHFPRIPVEDDGRLHNPAIRENFIERIFSLKRWRDIAAISPSIGKLVDFHSRNKLLLLSHSQKHYRLMGKLVAGGKKMPMGELYDQYQLLLMEALKLKTTIRRNSRYLLIFLKFASQILIPSVKILYCMEIIPINSQQ